jgi:hypothetical protein
MAMVLYMPWCRIDHDYPVGDITILPFEPARQPTDLDDGAWSRACTILGTHKDINGNPVDRAAVIQYAGRALMDDLSDAEIHTAGDLVALACFAGIASREYFRPHFRYCNSDCFTFYLQKWDGSGSTFISTRRRDGRSLSGWPLSRVAVSVPVHCHAIKDVAIDQTLLDGLILHRAASSDREWGRWQNSVACFNLANTDSETIREHVEWVLLSSAFEHLLEAKPEAKDVARLFEAMLVPHATITAAGSICQSGRSSPPNVSLRHEWMREFYRVRGDFAHGKLASQQPMAWKSCEHLMLATIGFPLIAKLLLAGAGRYQFTEDDSLQIDCFEALADTPDFFVPPADAKGSWDSKWGRLLEQRRGDLATEKFRSELLRWENPGESRG